MPGSGRRFLGRLGEWRQLNRRFFVFSVFSVHVRGLMKARVVKCRRTKTVLAKSLISLVVHVSRRDHVRLRERFGVCDSASLTALRQQQSLRIEENRRRASLKETLRKWGNAVKGNEKEARLNWAAD